MRSTDWISGVILGVAAVVTVACVAHGSGCWDSITANCCNYAYPVQPHWGPRSCNCPDIPTKNPLRAFVMKTDGSSGRVSAVTHEPEECAWIIRNCINGVCVNTGQTDTSNCYPESPAGLACGAGGGGN